MTKKEIREELKSILKDYHYNSDSEQMSKDVVIALENLIGYLKWATIIGAMVRSAVNTTHKIE